MIVNKLIDAYVWWFLQLYFLPYRLPEFGSDIDRVISQYSLNGLCRRR
jgi:hypothetical protein